MRSLIVKYIVEYGKLPTGNQQEIMDYTFGFTYALRPILPQMLEAVFVYAARMFTDDSFLLLYAARMGSVLCGIVFAAYVRLIAKRLFDRGTIQWLFTLIAVCLPQASFLFTYLNCDSMALTSTAMIIWYLLKGFDDDFSIPTCLKLSLSFSICILSYYDAYGILITGAVAYFGYYIEKAHRGMGAWKDFWKKGFLILGGVAILSGWWFVRNYFLYDGDFIGLRTQTEYAERYALDVYKPSNKQTYKSQGYSILYMLLHSTWVLSVAKSFVGKLGPLWYELRWWMYAGYAAIFAAGASGAAANLIVKLRGRKRGEPVNYQRILWHMGLIIAIIVPNILSIMYSYANDYQPQGRYSMPMLVPFMYYIVKGLYFWIKAVEKRVGALLKKAIAVVTVLVCIWIAAVDVFCVAKIMWPAYKDVEDKSQATVYTIEQ